MTLKSNLSHYNIINYIKKYPIDFGLNVNMINSETLYPQPFINKNKPPLIKPLKYVIKPPKYDSY